MTVGASSVEKGAAFPDLGDKSQVEDLGMQKSSQTKDKTEKS